MSGNIDINIEYAFSLAAQESLAVSTMARQYVDGSWPRILDFISTMMAMHFTSGVR
jgi:hypothetical protein